MALVVIVVSFSSFSDNRWDVGASVVVGPCALVVFSSFAASIHAVLLTGVSLSFPGSLTTCEVVQSFDTSPTHWGIHLKVVVGHGACILRPVRKTVCAASHSVIAALCLAASCFLYAWMWASYCQGRVGAGIDEVDGFLGKEVILLL